MITRRSLWFTVIFFILSVFIVANSDAAFQDTEEHWAADAIAKWNEYGVINGYDGFFRPNDEVTRAEFSMMINNILKYIEKGENHFTDLDDSAWYTDAMLRLSQAGVMVGADGKAMPQNNITRQEAALMIANAFQLTDGSRAPTFTDDVDIAPWAKDAVNALVSRKVIRGMPDGTFQPRANLTRAQAVTMFNQFIAVLLNEQEEYSGDISGNAVINTTDVTLKDATIDGDLYIAQGVGDGDVTLENVVINGSIFVNGGGDQSILFNNVDVKGALVVNKYDGKVRIVATGNTTVSVTILESGAILVTKDLSGGGFEIVEISADIVAGQSVVLDGTFNQVINYSENVTITANGTIEELVSEVNTNIEGDVTIKKLTEKEGVETKLNDKKIDSATINRSSGGGGFAGGGGGRSSRSVAVTGVSIDEPANVYLFVGESKQLTATVEPSNASNKKISWKVEDGSSDVVTVNEEGVVTATGVGTKTVQVITDDGGKTDQIVVHVSKPPFGITLTPFTSSMADEETVVDEQVFANSENVTITELQPRIHENNSYESLLVANHARLETNDPAGHYTYVVVTLTNVEGEPIADASGITASVTDAVYAQTNAFGEGLNDRAKPGSFILKVNADQPESIRHHVLTFQHEDYAETTLTLIYIPDGKAYVTAIEPITGEKTVGSTLTAGIVTYKGDPTDDQLTYLWLRSETEQGPYTLISGADRSTYELTEEDSGQYIRVVAIADQVHAGGSVASAPFGPVGNPVEASEVFAAIEAQFLADNKDRQNIETDLNLMTSLKDFPGITIVWSSDNVQVIDNNGKVKRHHSDDQTVNLTATLSGHVNGTKTKTYKLIVPATGTDPIDDEHFIDPYFKDDYPQAYVEDGTIWVRFQLNQPAEVYMIVNALNGRTESSVQAVLEGRSGKNDIIWVDAWPYVHVTDPDQLYEFDTDVRLSPDRPARVEFVIVDKEANYTSEAVTTILFEQEAVDALDTYPPQLLEPYINRSLSEIYVYYSEKLDLSSVPKASDFTLNIGNVDGVTLFNDERLHAYPSSYVKLSVSGISEKDKHALTLSYHGDAIQDVSDAKNKAEPFNKREVIYIEEQIEDAFLSYDRKTMIITIVPGFSMYENDFVRSFNDVTRFSIEVEGKGTYQPSQVDFHSYWIRDFEYKFEFAEPLPEGKKKLTIETADIINWAMDPYPNQLTYDNVSEISHPGKPTAQYSHVTGDILLSFADGFEFGYAAFVGGFVLQIDGEEFPLRGYIGSTHYDRNRMFIRLGTRYAEHIKEAVDAGNEVQIKYVKQNGNQRDQLEDAGGILIPDFDYVPVTKMP